VCEVYVDEINNNKSTLYDRPDLLKYVELSFSFIVRECRAGWPSVMDLSSVTDRRSEFIYKIKVRALNHEHEMHDFFSCTVWGGIMS